MEAVFAATRPAGEDARPLLRQFLEERSPAQALRHWIRLTAAPGRPASKEQVARSLGRAIARLDAILTKQTNAILHHPKFQKLESAWRGLRYLVEQAEGAENVKIRVLSVSWKELSRDAERAVEFDQSQLFRKVYSEEFDTPGGEPFGVLLGDYEIRHRLTEEHPVDDVATLKAISGVAAAAFAPFIASAHPSLFGMNEFATLEQPLNLPRAFDQLEYLKWQEFRSSEDSRFVGLALPRVLMRLPHMEGSGRTDGFCFREDVAGPDREKYLWGNAVYALGAVLIRSFSQSGWLADIRGVRRDEEGGGIVCGLPVHSFATDKRGVATKTSTEVVISDRQESELSRLGFIPLCHCTDTEFSAFYTNQSVQKPRAYDEPAATMNARLSTMLQYTLCVSRFAHYIKAIARDKMGTFSGPEECEDFLHRWLQKYVTPDSEASAEVKARHPLREAQVQVSEHPAKPGSYRCTAHLWPHFELEELAATLKLTTELTQGRTG
jgi:type VI secretion system protein ImpD